MNDLRNNVRKDQLKKCASCNLDKESNNYTKDSSRNDNLSVYCKLCSKKRVEDYHKTKKGVCTQIYAAQRQSSNRRGYHIPAYSKNELTKWLLGYDLFNHLYEEWVDSGYLTPLKPSIDRIDDSKSYSFENIRLITWRENLMKQKDKEKVPVNQLKNDIIINNFISIAEANKITGIPYSNISACINGVYKTAGGFNWKYKNE